MRDYFDNIDKKAAYFANQLSGHKKITRDLMIFINTLYEDSKVEREYDDDNFKSAYHFSITSFFEFAFARILFHYSRINSLSWKIFLRKQVGKTAPDVRIEKDGRTIVIFEVKVKGGWIQPFLSKERYLRDSDNLRNGVSTFEPDSVIERVKGQLEKYKAKFGGDVRIYMLLPTYAMVHRKLYSSTFEDYKSWFSKITGLSNHNLIVMSRNLSLNLDSDITDVSLDETSDIENTLRTLSTV